MAAAKKPAKRMSAKQMKKTKGGLAIPPMNANMEATANRQPPVVAKLPAKRVLAE